MFQPNKSRKYFLSYNDYCALEVSTELCLSTPNFIFGRLSEIDFNNSSITNSSGKKAYFDGLSEEQFVCVMNGGYYEEAPEILEAERV